MIITKVEPVTRSRFTVEIDGEFAFVLYKGELSRYHIKEEAEITEDTLEEIRNGVIVKRAKRKAMHLLSDMDRTESQLRTKLSQGLYKEDVIEAAVSYVKSFGYVDDSGYAERFIKTRKGKKSKKEICAALTQKGLSQAEIEEAIEAHYQSEDSQSAIEQLVKKKGFDFHTATPEEKNKIIGFLMRKGFSYGDVRQVIQVSEWNA